LISAGDEPTLGDMDVIELEHANLRGVRDRLLHEMFSADAAGDEKTLREVLRDALLLAYEARRRGDRQVENDAWVVRSCIASDLLPAFERVRAPS
jgi:hypothetical protein